jgi:hypothetical protein
MRTARETRKTVWLGFQGHEAIYRLLIAQGSLDPFN